MGKLLFVLCLSWQVFCSIHCVYITSASRTLNSSIYMYIYIYIYMDTYSVLASVALMPSTCTSHTWYLQFLMSVCLAWNLFQKFYTWWLSIVLWIKHVTSLMISCNNAMKYLLWPLDYYLIIKSTKTVDVLGNKLPQPNALSAPSTILIIHTHCNKTKRLPHWDLWPALLRVCICVT